MIKTTDFIKICRFLACLGFSAIIIMHSLNRLDIPVVSRMNHMFYDLRLMATMPDTLDERIVIIDIDEKSLLQEGQWPWPRNKLAYMMDMLFEYYNVNLLGFDVAFTERDDSSGLPLLERLGRQSLNGDEKFKAVLDKLRPQLSYDDLLAESFRGRNVILGYFASHEAIPVSSETSLPAPVSTADGAFADFLFQAQSYGGNLGLLQKTAQSGGFFNNLGIDADGVSRRLPLLFEYKNHIYESLALAVFRQYQGNAPLEFVTNDGYSRQGELQQLLENLKINGFSIPVDSRGAVLIPYRGKQGKFPYVPATDVLNGVVDIETLENKIALLGTSAAGLFDLRSTPVQKAYAGVEIHANIISGILDQSIKSRPNYIIGYELLELLFISGIIIFLFPSLSPLKTAMLFVILSVAIFSTNLYLWQYQNLDSNLATPIILLCSLFSIQLFFAYFFEARRKKHLGTLFGQYIPPELVDQINRSGENFSLKGQSKDMTVLFSDVRGFTTISESLKPQDLCNLINDILTPVTRIIHENNGTIDKYIGDAVMAFWGAPLDNEDHAVDAIKAALDMLKRLTLLQQDFERRSLPYIDIGIGINTGVMSVGNMGSQFRTAYTVMGDAVNLGSRLEGLTKYYGVKLIVSESTKNAADMFPIYVYRELDRVKVKGKTEPVTLYEVVGETKDSPINYQEYLCLLNDAFFHYYLQHWDRAEDIFSRLQRQAPDDMLHRLYLDRIAAFRIEPPGEDWDGIFVHTSK